MATYKYGKISPKALSHYRQADVGGGAKSWVSLPVADSPNLVRLTGKEIIPLNNRVALVGIDGWADASAGTGAKTKVRLNDDNNIFDLLFLADQNARFDFMLQLAQSYAATLRPTLASALEKYDEVIVATHVPPFIEATWHEGKLSGPDYLPLFSSPTIGRVILEVAGNYPDKTICVYCGHTHSSGFFETINIKCWSGGARYYYPEIQSLISLPK